jgi:hypothetical protein
MPDGSKANPAHPRGGMRDVRLDFFRGIGMFIIFIAHVPRNPWNDWIPARFGFSDATEIFVFCSGMASAIAFASVFDRAGFAHGVARVLHRCWQVYWCHIGLFLTCATMMVAADQYFGTGSQFVNSLSIGSFFSDTPPALLGLFTLTYVPNLFDILPMYLVVLALIPIVMALSLLGGWAPLLFCGSLWWVGWYGEVNLPAEPWGERTWFFNPLAWQAIFFTGFAFLRGWFPAPPIDRRLVSLASAILLLTIPFAHHWGIERLPDGLHVPHALIDKNNFGPLRYVHFLALAYLAYAAAGPGGVHLRGQLVSLCCKVGQQSLAVFIAGIVFSLMGGIALARIGYSISMVTAVNLAGFGGLIVVAYTVAWFKSKPWAMKRMATSSAAPSQSQAAE